MRTVFGILLLACVLTWFGEGGQPLAGAAEGSSCVSSTTSGGIAVWTASAPVGSCERCGRDVTSPYGLNTRVMVHSPRRDWRVVAPVWSGCMDCLVETLERGK